MCALLSFVFSQSQNFILKKEEASIFLGSELCVSSCFLLFLSLFLSSEGGKAIWAQSLLDIKYYSSLKITQSLREKKMWVYFMTGLPSLMFCFAFRFGEWLAAFNIIYLLGIFCCVYYILTRCFFLSWFFSHPSMAKILHYVIKIRKLKIWLCSWYLN